jgi:hypothetical protein
VFQWPRGDHILSSLVSAHAVTTSTSTFNYITDANGNVGVVSATRSTDPATNVTTTTMTYTFCIQTTAPSFQEGSGTIPNDAFAGTLTSSIDRAEILNPLVDTTKWGFVNQLCYAPDQFGGCTQGTSPATGGVVHIHYVKKLGRIQIVSQNILEEDNYKVTLNSLDSIYQFSGSATGHIFGTNVSDKIADMAFETQTGNGTPGSKAKEAISKALGPQAARRLERLQKLAQ